MRIVDREIRSFTENLQRQPNPKLDDRNVLELLAGVGDRWDRAASSVLSQLTRPGISRQEQFDLARGGLSSVEKRDLETLLDQSGFQMDPGAKNFLEALTGRAALQATFGPLTITGDQSRGLQGTAKPGETIEAINLSTAPAGRLHLTDTMVVGRADELGKFSGTLPDMKEGDVVRLRSRAADGTTSDWVTIKAKGIEATDSRNAAANLERIDLAAASDGTVSATHNTARPLSEPGATLRITNTRTQESKDVRVTENGSLPPDLKLNGRAGDTFSVAVSDGVNNTNFATVAGTLKVPGGDNVGPGRDLPDPAAVSDDRNADGTARFSKTRFTGPLYIDDPSSADVRQGAIGNCYFPAALAAVAHAHPEKIREMIKDNGDGTYTVAFHESNMWGGAGLKHEVTVDGDLFARSWGGPVYGGSLGGSTEPDKMELWFPIIEKAYAEWKGGTDRGYDAIGHGGVAGQVMSEVMGRPYNYHSVNDATADRVFERITRGMENQQPMAAGTYGKDEAARYTNSGVYANHAYSVLGTEVTDGKRYVLLRNPWGQSEPGNDGRNDGFFKLELSEFVRLYQSFHIVDQ
ncbi:MAG: hypothetical protein HYZ28_00200 [Myxococcales bacterium]|nr:hypothetical protein [Myxococcales bacterium]